MNVRLDTSLETLLDRAPPPGIRRVLATIVSTTGSTYRKSGARMLIMADGTFIGLLSGGCLESDLLLHAREVMEVGRARAIEYDMRGPDDVLFGLGAGCEGAMRLLLEPAQPGGGAMSALEHAAQRCAHDEPAVLVMIHESGELPLGTHHDLCELPPAFGEAARLAGAESASRTIEWQGPRGLTRGWVEYLARPPHLLICGAGPDAQPVVAVARALGWRVTVVDHRPRYAAPESFPGAQVLTCEPRRLREQVDVARCHAAVVMSHHLASDAAYLTVLGAGVCPGYIGLLGPTSRRVRLLHELGRAADALRSRIRGPVGFDIGAVTPDGIALSIVAEIHSWLAGRTGRADAHRASIA